MENRDYEKLEKMLCKELKEITDRGSLTSGSIETIKGLTGSIKNIHKIMKDDENMGYSQYGGTYRNYGNGNSYGNSDDNYSQRGHYVRGHYSRAEDGMMNTISEKMNDPRLSVDDKVSLSRAMDILQR